MWKCLQCYDQLWYYTSYSYGSQDREKRPCSFCLPDEYTMWQRKRSKQFLANCCVAVLVIVIIVVMANLIGLGLKEMTRP